MPPDETAKLAQNRTAKSPRTPSWWKYLTRRHGDAEERGCKVEPAVPAGGGFQCCCLSLFAWQIVQVHNGAVHVLVHEAEVMNVYEYVNEAQRPGDRPRVSRRSILAKAGEPQRKYAPAKLEGGRLLPPEETAKLAPIKPRKTPIGRDECHLVLEGKVTLAPPDPPPSPGNPERWLGTGDDKYPTQRHKKNLFSHILLTFTA